MRERFGDFVLDLDKHELTERGETRHLSTKAFALLELLVTSAPRALTKEELYRHIWGDTFVEEVNLPNLISEIRSALGESRKNPRFVKTIHGFGYAFSGEVKSEAAPARSRRAAQIFSVQWGREEFPLREGENVLGRDESADVIIDSASVSRRHAIIAISKGAATLEDLGSKNGTFVRGERINGPVPLRDRDEVRLGHVNLLFRIAARTQTTVTHAATGPDES